MKLNGVGLTKNSWEKGVQMPRKFQNLNVNYQISCIAEFFWRKDVKKMENQKSYLQKIWRSSFLI